MKALIGLFQFACLGGGVVALFNGQWLGMIGSWLLAGLVGVAGNRLVRRVDGVSETGRQAMSQIPRSIELLRRGECRAASGVTRSMVSNFRMGGDKYLLPFAQTIHDVALASVNDAAGAETAVTEAKRLTAVLPPIPQVDVEVLREMQGLVERELRKGLPDADSLVREFLALDDA